MALKNGVVIKLFEQLDNPKKSLNPASF